MIAPLHWEVLAMVPRSVDGATVGLANPDGSTARCGHRHGTADEASACPWTPDPWPEVCDLFVRQVRTEAPPVQARMPWAASAGRRAR